VHVTGQLWCPACGNSECTCTPGRKDDSKKLRYSLLPLVALEEVVRVLEFGAEKYAVDNWRKVPDGKVRYWDAAMRHVLAYKRGELLDPESGLSHLAHAICCLMFIEELS
jgi:hypothetical protein